MVISWKLLTNTTQFVNSRVSVCSETAQQRVMENLHTVSYMLFSYSISLYIHIYIYTYIHICMHTYLYSYTYNIYIYCIYVLGWVDMPGAYVFARADLLSSPELSLSIYPIVYPLLTIPWTSYLLVRVKVHIEIYIYIIC